MTTYTVLSPTDAFGPGLAEAERATFVPERFSWMTLFFAPLVLLRYRLWLALLAYVAVAVLMEVSVQRFGLADNVSFIVMSGFNLLLAFELPRLRAAKLRRKGNAEAGIVIAPSREEAERRFYTTLLAANTVPAPAPRAPAEDDEDEDEDEFAPLPAPARRTAFPGAAPQPSVIGSFPGDVA